MLHVVFQHADKDVLKKAMEVDTTLSGDIIEVRDDFAVGPLVDIDTDEGWDKRVTWWKILLSASPYHDLQISGFDDRRTLEELKRKMGEDLQLEVWIWMAQNQHDVCGYFWLIPQLRDFQGRVIVLYLNNLPFINEKGLIFYPETLHQILPKEFTKAKKLNRKITLSEFELDTDEWKKLSAENSIIRVLEGGKKIVGKEIDFYDNDILNGVTNEWQKGNRVIHHILSKMKIKTGDVFLLWRMKQLESDGKIEINGDPNMGWKEFEIKKRRHIEEEIIINTGQNV